MAIVKLVPQVAQVTETHINKWKLLKYNLKCYISLQNNDTVAKANI